MKGLFEIDRIKRTSHFSMTVNHFHEFYELYYLLSGERFYFIHNATYHVRQGDLIFVDKRLLHKTIDTGVPAHERILIHFNDALLNTPELTNVFRTGSPILRVDAELSTEVRRLLLRMLQESSDKDIYYSSSIENLVSELLILCARHKHKNNDDHDTVNNNPPLSLHPRMTEIIHYLNDHFAHPLTLTMIADMFHLSPTYVSRTFKRATGFSFIEFLNLTRIREAQRLLRETTLPIIHIADEAGFQSITHFGRVFKQISTCSPREFRERARRDNSGYN